MNVKRLTLLVLLSTLLLLAFAGRAAADQMAPHAPRQLIISFQPGVTDGQAGDFLGEHNLQQSKT